MSQQAWRMTEKIARLRALTAERGATADEAQAAADKVDELMRRYGVSETMVGLERATADLVGLLSEHQSVLWQKLGRHFGCFCLVHGAPGVARVSYFGRSPGPGLAEHWHHVLARTHGEDVQIWRCTPRLRVTTERRRQALVEDFTLGWVSHMILRLAEIPTPTDADHGAGADVVPDPPPDPGGVGRPRDEDAVATGWAAAGIVPLHAAGAGVSALQALAPA